jgi:eukaryotic-like serine/threonine-protein kinase
MNAERWKRIQELFHHVVPLSPEERARFLDRECVNDPSMKAEIEELVHAHQATGKFVRSRPGPTILPGQEFGAYRVEALIGAGGMAQVFRAKDTRLHRTVAIKVGLDRFNERFEREARAIAALNHPHICTLYDVGPDYLVMELVEGETLAAQILGGPLPFNTVLQYGREIADALAEAHNAGIVHRDLKPGNVMITRHGVKVLDFGLAKVKGPDAALTGQGAVMGTPAYMSPEQFAGKEVGPQSDLFALGLVLYEMTTGKRPLPATSLGQVLLGAPTPIAPMSKVRPEASVLDRLVSRLLAPDPSQRPASAAVVANELRALATPKPKVPRVAVAVIAAVAVIGVAVTGWLASRNGDPARPEVAGIAAITNLTGNEVDPAYSPDGKSIAFSWLGQDGKSPGIYLLERDAHAPHRLTQAPSTATDIAPAWSPDGSEIAFERLNPEGANELIVVRVVDRSERKLRDVRQSVPLTNGARPLLTWTPDGRAIVIPTQDVDANARASLFRIGVHGEPPQRLFQSTAGEGDAYPAFSPDGRWLAYGLVDRRSTRLFVRRMGPDGSPAGPPQEVPEGAGTGAAPVHSPAWSTDSRRLVFVAGSRLLEWELGGAVREVWVSEAQPQALTTLWTGAVLTELVYAKEINRWELRELRLDAQGRHAEGPPLEFMHRGSIAIPQLSPDGRWVIFGESFRLWIASADGTNPRQLSKLRAGSGTSFSVDSRHVAFHKTDEIFAPLYVVDLDENGAPTAEKRVAQTTSFSLVGASWSTDGKYLYTTAIKTPSRIMRARVSDGELEDLFDGATAVVSSDGRKIFYKKATSVSGLFVRSLEGKIANNPDKQLVPECVMPWGIAPTRRGVYYVGCNERQGPVAIRYFEFSTSRSFDVGAPPLGPQPMLTVSRDGRRLLYHTVLPNDGELTRVSFRQTDRANR